MKSLKWDSEQPESDTARVLVMVGEVVEDEPAVCEICGAEAVGGCTGPDGAHLYCETHREMVEESVPEEWDTDEGDSFGMYEMCHEDERGGERVEDAPTTPPLGSLVDGRDFERYSDLSVKTAGRDMYARMPKDGDEYAESEGGMRYEDMGY